MNKNLEKILASHPDFNVEKFMRGEADISSRLYEDLYEIYAHEMPYGTAKARTGDPIAFISDRLFEVLAMEPIFPVNYLSKGSV